MPCSSPISALDKSWIIASIQQSLLVVGFQKGRIALAKMLDDIFTRGTNVGKDAYVNVLAGNSEAVGIYGIV